MAQVFKAKAQYGEITVNLKSVNSVWADVDIETNQPCAYYVETSDEDYPLEIKASTYEKICELRPNLKPEE